MNETKSISSGQLYQNIWKNPPADITTDTERAHNYSKIFNPQLSYDTVCRQPSVNHQHILWKNPLADITKDTEKEQNRSKIVNPQRSYDTASREPSINKMERVKSVDAWINETQNLSRNTINQDITMAWLLQQNVLYIEISNFKG